MVKITELPITGKMLEDFQKFFRLHEGPGGWDYMEMITYNPESPGDVPPICSVCGHGLKYIFVYSKDGNRHGFGVVCASNLEALQKKDIDKLNYDRTVKLQRKTILKRMIEHQTAQNKLNLEVQHYDKVHYIVDIYNRLLDEYGEYTVSSWMVNSYSNSHPFKRYMEFFVSLYYSYERGKLSEKQLSALGRSINKMTVDERMNAFAIAYDEEMDRQSKKNRQSRHYYIVYDMIDKWGLNDWERKFLKSVKEWFEAGKNYSEKQMETIRNVHDKHHETTCEQMELY